MQTAAEYRACCLQTYQWMAERLRVKLALQSNNGAPPAVVLDLDETLFQTNFMDAYSPLELGIV